MDLTQYDKQKMEKIRQREGSHICEARFHLETWQVEE